MKKYLICIFLIFTGLAAVFSQSNNASFFIIPVTGIGASTEDNGFFYRQIQFEAELQRYIVVNNRQTANYTLEGTLSPDDSVSDDLNLNDRIPRDYLFSLALINNSTNEVIAEQELIYQSTRDVGSFIPIIIYNLLSSIPVTQITQNAQNTQESQETQNVQETQQDTQETDRRYNRLYVGADIIWTPKYYPNSKHAFNALNFGFALSAEWQFFRFLSIGAGAVFIADWHNMEKSSTGTAYFPDLGMEIPFTLRFIFKPGENTWIVPFGGIHYNLAIIEAKAAELSPLSWLAGLQFGIGTGRGIMVFTPSFSMDINNYQRMLFYLGIGYKYGFLKR
jgi:hypothetical protein